jgi:hypothetical protein
MEHTLNAAGGDVAICTLYAEPEHFVSELDRNRVSFVAPLRTRSDLESLLRTLHLRPHVRHLVLCGDDLRASGAALLALWDAGIDGAGRLPGSRGSLSPELDAESLDAIRRNIQLWDWRDEAPAAVASKVLGLPALARERQARTIPKPTPPERTVFLSRKTTFPIFSDDAGDAWLQLLNLVLRIGTEKVTSAGDRLAEALNAVVTIELPDAEGELAPFLEFNDDDFEHYYRRFSAPTPSEEPRHVCGERLFDRVGIDQLESVIDRLKQSHDTRSGTLVLLGPDDLGTPDAAPSIVSASFHVIDEQLFGSFVLRSTDVYNDWPFQALSLIRVQRGVAQRLGIGVGTASFVVHSAHVHDRDWARALRVLAESFKRPLPLQVDPSGIFLFGNDGGEARAMLLDHDADDIFWEEAFSDPEDLSWYIVDVMPWLLPQHIRYIGQECASLMRAIRENECYEQG